MADMLDYLDWRGDISFSADPFNEVDNLILCELAYVDFAGIVPGLPEAGEKSETESIGITEVCRRYWEMHTEEEVLNSSTLFKMAPFLLKKLCSGTRFSHMRLTGFVNHISASRDEQMCAVTCLLDDDTAFVSYRGTDDTLVGWKEDFTFSYKPVTGGQRSAVDYLNRSAAANSLPLRIGGHSKGGNFAVYAASFCDDKIRDRITDVFTNDGPGFLEEVTESDRFKQILPKVHSFVPEESLFGQLLGVSYYHKIVKSSEKGIMQHDAMSWKILRNHFEEAEDVTQASILLKTSLSSWINGMSMVERYELVQTFFSLFEDAGIKNLSELTEAQSRAIPELVRTYRYMDGEDKRLIRDAVGRLLRSGAESFSEELQEKIRTFHKKGAVASALK